jgi:hypothetical protein
MFPFYQSVKDYALEVGSSPRVWQAEERHRHKIRVGKSLSFRYFQKTAFKKPHENGDSAQAPLPSAQRVSVMKIFATGSISPSDMQPSVKCKEDNQIEQMHRETNQCLKCQAV